MHQEASSQLIELTEELPEIDGVRFDPESITLEGIYSDELSAYRARKVWTETLKSSFLLELDHDIQFKIVGSNSTRFILSCEFKTACARYAFWRLTNHQAPEAQYQIETGHIPQCESREEDFLRAPDMRPKSWDIDGPFVDNPGRAMIRVERRTFMGVARALYRDFRRSLRSR